MNINIANACTCNMIKKSTCLSIQQYVTSVFLAFYTTVAFLEQLSKDKYGLP